VADTVSVKIEGLEELRATLQRLGRDAFTKPEVEAGLRAGGQVVRKEAIARAARADAPHRLGRSREIVQPGNLKRNITVRRNRNTGGHFASVSVGVRSKAFYWRFLEFGTRKMRARPFLRPAFSGRQEPALAAIIERLKKRLDAAVRKAGV